MKKTVTLSIACAALAALSLAAVAQSTATAPAAGASAPKKTITRDEYRACMNDGDALKTRAEGVKANGAKVSAESEALQAEEEQLKAEQKRSEESLAIGARDRFERKVKQHSARIAAFEKQREEVKKDVDAFTKDLDAYNARCSNVSINREDKEAVDQERAAAGKK